MSIEHTICYTRNIIFQLFLYFAANKPLCLKPQYLFHVGIEHRFVASIPTILKRTPPWWSRLVQRRGYGERDKTLVVPSSEGAC